MLAEAADALIQGAGVVVGETLPAIVPRGVGARASKAEIDRTLETIVEAGDAIGDGRMGTDAVNPDVTCPIDTICRDRP